MEGNATFAACAGQQERTDCSEDPRACPDRCHTLLAFLSPPCWCCRPGSLGVRTKEEEGGRGQHSPLTQQERVLQALNRLTFGPRPGDVAAVEAMGLDKWIDQQLHPETIDDSALEARLAAYPAMGLSLRDLVALLSDAGNDPPGGAGQVGSRTIPWSTRFTRIRSRTDARAAGKAAGACGAEPGWRDAAGPREDGGHAAPMVHPGAGSRAPGGQAGQPPPPGISDAAQADRTSGQAEERSTPIWRRPAWSLCRRNSG